MSDSLLDWGGGSELSDSVSLTSPSADMPANTYLVSSSDMSSFIESMTASLRLSLTCVYSFSSLYTASNNFYSNEYEISSL